MRHRLEVDRGCGSMAGVLFTRVRLLVGAWGHTGTDWIDLVRSRIAEKDPVRKRLKGFKSLSKNGAEKSGQYWNETPLPEG